MVRRLTVFTVFTLLALPGCFDPATNEGGLDSGTFDASTFDAGPHDGSLPDASIPDGALPDVVLPDAGPKLVSVLVRTAAGPEQGITVVFQDSTGAVTTSANTNAMGLVAQLVPSGSMVTALLGSPTNPRPVTILAVEPGDLLTLLDDSNSTFTSDTISIDSVPASPPAGTLGFYARSGPCGAYMPMPPGTYASSLDCQLAGKFPLLVLAQGDTGNIGYTYQKALTLPGDGGTVHVDPDGGWFSTFGAPTVSASNLPDGGTQGYSRFVFTEVAGGVANIDVTSFSGVSLDGGPIVQAFEGHPGYPDFVQSEANIQPYANFNSIMAIATRAPASTMNAAFDLSQLLPLISNATIDTTAPTRPVVTWTSAGSLTSTDGAIVVVNWNTLLDAGGNAYGTWTIVAPPSVTSVTVPALPTASAAWGPDATSTINQLPFVFFIEATFIPGYAQLRAAAGSFASVGGTNGNPPFVPTLPVDGTLRLTGYTVSGD